MYSLDERNPEISPSNFFVMSSLYLLYFLLNFLDYPLQSCSRKEDFTLIKERQVPEHQSPKLDVWKHPNPYVKWTWTQSFAVCQSLWEGRKSAETQKNRGDKKAKFDPRCKMLRGKKQSLWEEFLSRKTWTSLPYKHLGIRNSSPCMLSWRLSHFSTPTIILKPFDGLWIARF